MTNVTLISFVGDNSGELDPSWKQRQDLLHQTALQYGDVTTTRAWAWEDIRLSSFYQENSQLLDQPRGCGYWAWKPWIILESLKQVDSGDYVLYHDVGKAFRAGDPAKGGDNKHGNVIELSVRSIIDWAEEHGGIFPGVNIPHYGPASQWTKRDTFVGLGCDDPAFWKLPLVQAGYNAWKHSPEVLEFLGSWLTYCCDPRFISDQPNELGLDNLPDFKEHRHDQSVLSCLLRREKKAVYGSQETSKAYVRNFNFLVRKTALEARQAENLPTVTSTMSNAGSSWDLPVSVTNWIDLDLAARSHESLKILVVRAGENAEESILRSAIPNAEWHLIDWTRPDDSTINRPNVTDFDGQLVTDPIFHWVLCYGFYDQSLLCQAVRLFMPLLQPMGFMIAGLDHSHVDTNEQTFASFIKNLAQSRVLHALSSQGENLELNLVVGSASNPVPLKQRQGKPLVASIQRGLLSV